MNFYRDITFAAPSTGLTNFPALVRIQNDRMKKRISSPNGFDVSFQQNGTDIPFELDFYDSSTGSGAWWVKIPTLPANNPTTIRMVYGDSNISTDPSSPSTVWSDYLAVYHFNETTIRKDVDRKKQLRIICNGTKALIDYGIVVTIGHNQQGKLLRHLAWVIQ